MEVIHPKSKEEWLELRSKDVTSTDISALFGLSPYCTPFELWHRKKAASVVSIEENEYMKWGSRLQDSIAQGVAEDNGWNVRRMDEYIRIPELRAGSSFDFSIEGVKSSDEITATTMTKDQVEGRWIRDSKGLLEIKNVFGMQFRENWTEDDGGNIEAPAHIELQVQYQLMVSGRAFAYIAALIDGNKVVLIKRTPDDSIIGVIKNKLKSFWQSVDANSPPQPNFETDSEFISKLYGYSEPGKVFDARNDVNFTQLALEHKELGSQIKAMESRRDAIKGQMLTVIGDAEKVLADGFTVTASTVGPARVEYDRGGYRLFKLNFPRSKK